MTYASSIKLSMSLSLNGAENFVCMILLGAVIAKM